MNCSACRCQSDYGVNNQLFPGVALDGKPQEFDGWFIVFVCFCCGFVHSALLLWFGSAAKVNTDACNE